MSDIKKYLGVDLGAESGRVFIGTLADGKLTVEEAHRFANGYVVINGRMRWDTFKLFGEIKTGLKKAIAKCGGYADGIGIDTWGVDFGLFDENGDISTMPYQYRDPKFIGASEEAFKIVGREEMFEKIGIQTMDINTIFQLWRMKQLNPASLKNAKKLLFMPDIFNYWLTGVMKTEYSIASTSQMLNVHKKDWAYDILERLGIPTEMLPEINMNGQVLGTITDEIKEELGAKNNIPVYSIGEHDTASAVLSVPSDKENFCFISCGTWSLMGMELDKPLVTEASCEANYTNEGGAFGTIRFLKNITGLWIIQECRRYWEAEGKTIDYGEITARAAACEGFKSLINPNNQIFVQAGNMIPKIQNYCKETGQPVPEGIGEIIRCGNDSLALAYRQVVDNLEELTGKEISQIHMVGGGTKNVLLSKLTANVTGKTVVTGPIEGTVIGNLLIQALGEGVVKDIAEARQIVRNSEPINVIKPDPAFNCDEVYEKFVKLP